MRNMRPAAAPLVIMIPCGCSTEVSSLTCHPALAEVKRAGSMPVMIPDIFPDLLPTRSNGAEIRLVVLVVPDPAWTLTSITPTGMDWTLRLSELCEAVIPPKQSKLVR